MEAGQYIKMLAEFVTGDINLTELKGYIEERLVELREKPEMTEEKELLSSVELCLHEVDEGYRTMPEIYGHVQSILDNIILPTLTSKDKTEYVEPIVSKSPYFLSRIFDIELKPSDKKQTITRDFGLITSK